MDNDRKATIEIGVDTLQQNNPPQRVISFFTERHGIFPDLPQESAGHDIIVSFVPSLNFKSYVFAFVYFIERGEPLTYRDLIYNRKNMEIRRMTHKMPCNYRTLRKCVPITI